MPTTVVAYLRVSTDEQATHGVSLAAQRERITAYASLYDLTVVAFVEDAGLSAKTLARPGLQRALALLRSGEAQGLLVHKLDRLTRSVRDLADLLERYFAGGKFALLSVSEQIDTRSAGGRMVIGILATISQWERETASERTSCAMQSMRGRGLRVGGIPYGSRLATDGRHLEPEPAEVLVIAEARRLRAAGLSLAKVAARLAEAGMRARNGRVFLPVQIDRLLGEAA